MQANQDAPSWCSERSKSPQSPCREDFRHNKNEKRMPYICVHPELSSGDGLIQCDMVVDLPGQEYACLSYMWGSPADQKTILIDGWLFRVRDNLWRFLIRARLTGITRPIWIDAICIDQTNVDMRNHWVQQMGRIFKEAAEVLVWLGDGDKGIENRLDNMDRTTPRNLDDAGTAEEIYFPGIVEIRADEESSRTAITRLAKLGYWDRLWIKQEILLNQKVCYMYGKAKSYDLGSMLCFCDLSGGWCPRHSRFGVGRSACTTLLELSLETTAIIQHGRPLEELINRFADSTCMDVRDKVYGLLGMTKGCTLTVDYTVSPTELLVRTLVATSSFFDDAEGTVEYFIVLVKSLDLSEADLRRDDLDGLLRKYGGIDWQSKPQPFIRDDEWLKWTIMLEFEPFAIFAHSKSPNAKGLRHRKETVTSGNANEILEIRPPSATAWPFSISVDEVEQNTLLIGDARLKVDDVMFELVAGDIQSIVFLIARVCDSQRTAFEVTAVTDSARAFTSFYELQHRRGSAESIGITLFDPPSAFKRTMISLSENSSSFRDRCLLRLDIHQMISFSMTLSTLSSKQSWGWKTEKMTGMATAYIIKVRTAKRQCFENEIERGRRQNGERAIIDFSHKLEA